jgi:GT2 family glycosyltransferase
VSLRLAIVLIARNQANFVPRLVESILTEAAAYEPEVVLVDSASSDTTAARACTYPIGVLRLRDSELLTAAAARRAGTRATRGEAILFLDGDMELCAGWLSDALRRLEEDQTIGCITGVVIDAAAGAAVTVATAGAAGSATEVPYAGGAALYRRDALERAGGFNPFLHSDEEPELGVRVRACGYRIVQTRTPIAVHRGVADGSLAALLARRRRKLYLGAGETLRYLAGSPFFWTYVRERGYGFAPAAALVAGCACLATSILVGNWWPIAVWLTLVGVVLLADLARRRSPRRTLHSLVHRLFIIEGMARGLAVRRVDAAAYPAPETVQWIGEIRSG